MSDLQIPFETLENFGSEVESIRTRMNSTGRTFDNYEDDMGDDGVRDALSEFVDNWRDGRQEIDEQLTAIKEIASSIVAGFTEWDDETAASLEQEDGGGQQQEAV